MHLPARYDRLSDILRLRADETPHRIAVEDVSGQLSYGDLFAQASALAAELGHKGCQIGDRIFILIGNSRAFAVAFWAVQIAGAIAVPLPMDCPEDKLAWMVQDAEPFVILSETERTVAGAEVMALDRSTPQLARAQPAPPHPRVDADDLALMIYTSGSTGNPKGVMLSQKNVVTAACSVATYLGYRAEDRIFCAIPFSFDYGLHQLTMATLTGACVLAERDFSRPFVSLNRLARDKATVLPLVPTLGALISQIGGRFDLSQLRILTNTAAALNIKLIDNLREMMPQARLFSMYGLTECHRCTYLDPDQLDIRKESVGKAIPFTRMWVVDAAGQRHAANATGELVIAGNTVMQGYWRRPDATALRLHSLPETGEVTFHTGDICRLDAEGFCYFVGRADDILKVRGQKVAPVEIERCLTNHPLIAHAAVLGEDDPVLGTAIVAVVELKPGAHFSAAEIMAYASAHLPLIARPVRVQIETCLPRNGNGKIDKRAIRLTEAAL